MSLEKYLKEAEKIYGGQYATKLADMQRMKDEKLAEYDKSDSSLKSQYDNSLKENKKDGVVRVNNYNNNTLARGLGRSTIATTGIAGIENTTAQNANRLEAERASKLAELLSQRNNYLASYDREVNALNAEKESAMNNYAIQMHNKDIEYQRQQALAAASRRTSGGSGGSSGSFSTQANNNIRSMMNDFNSYMKAGDTRNARDVLFVAQEYRKAGLITNAEYNQMQNTLHKYETDREIERVAYSKPNTGKGLNAINYTYVNGQAVPTNKKRK